MKRYKNPWPKFEWPKDSSPPTNIFPSPSPPKIIEEKKNEDIHVQIDSRMVANIIASELKKEKQNLSFKDDKILFFLMLSMGFLGIFVLVIAIISLIITIQSSSNIHKLTNILR